LKRILLSHNSFRPGGGTEKFLKQIYKYVNNVEFEFLYTGNRYNDRGLIDDKNFIVHRIETKSLYSFKGLLSYLQLFRFFHKIKYDTIITTSPVIAICAISSSSNKIIFCLRNFWSFTDNNFLRIIKFIIRLKKIYLLTNNYESSKKLIDMGLDGDRVQYIPNGINIIPFDRKYKKQKRISLVMLGRFISTKRFDILTSAIKILYDRGYKFRATYIGEGLLKSKIQEDINNKNLGRIIQVKQYENLSQLDNFDIGLLITDTEGFPNTILEYGVKKIPIILSNFPGHQHIVQDNEDVLITDNSIENLSGKIITLIDSFELRKNLSMNFFKKIKSEYDIDKIFRRINEII
jgi:glycosyltransferase involved in cell wall biosynthesis